MKELKSLPKIIHQCMTIGEIPTSYKYSLTYEEQLMWFCKFLQDEVIPVVNNNSDAVQELQNYVATFFDNLDVQEEVNTKLDEMAGSGELEELIAEYLNTKAIIGFETKSEMKAGTNFIVGTIVKTLGNTNALTGDGHYYKVRTLTSGDVIDDDNIIALTNFPTLIAEKIPDYYLNQLASTISNIQDDISELTNEITVFVGDSYGASSMTNNWVAKYCEQNGLTLGTNAINLCTGGAGFHDIEGGTNTYLNEIQNISSSVNKNYVKKIIVAGGWNDRTRSALQLETLVSDFMTYVKANFPNAKVYCGMIANYGEINPTVTNINYREWLIAQILRGYQTINKYGGSYLSGVEEVMHLYSNFATDMVHPNEAGCIQLARAIKQAENTSYHLGTAPYSGLTLNTNTITKSAVVSNLNINLAGLIENGNFNLKTSGNISFSSYRLINASDDSVTIDIGTYTTDLQFFRYVNFLSDIPVKLKATFYQGSANEHPVYDGYLHFGADGTIQLIINNNYNATKYVSSFVFLSTPYCLPVLCQ